MKRLQPLQKELQDKDTQLGQLRNDLQETIVKNTLDLIEARDEALEASHSKTQLLADASHELRGSLHGILSYARMGLREASPLKQQNIHRSFAEISNCGARLLKLLNEILDLSRLEAHKTNFQFETSDFRGLFDIILAEYDCLAKDKKVQLTLSCPRDEFLMEFDSNRMLQVLRNLVSNAIKFCFEGSEIKLDLQLDHDKVAVSVLNQGPAIPGEEMGDIFERYVQSSLSSSDPGSGLGLSICKKIIQAHHGQISAQSHPDDWTAFTFWLPLAQEAPENSKPTEAFTSTSNQLAV